MESNSNLLPSNVAAVAAVIDPDAYTVATYVSAWVDLSTFITAMAVISAGALGAGATLDAKLEQATDSTGTSAKDITGKSITQLTQAGGDSDTQAIINVRDTSLDMANDFTHFRLSITIAVATSDVHAMVFGFNSHYGPANENNVSSVVEIIS